MSQPVNQILGSVPYQSLIKNVFSTRLWSATSDSRFVLLLDIVPFLSLVHISME